MSFDQEYMHGYIAHENHFNKIAQKANSIMGNITQCVIFEFDNTGHAFLAGNRPDFGEAFIEKKMYKVHEHIVYGNAVDKKIVPFFSSPCETLMFDKDVLLFGKEFNMEHGFLYTEKVTDADAFRMYAFTSDSKKIYNSLINDLVLVNKFIEYFTKESQGVINYYRERKFDLASQRDDYFDKSIIPSNSKKDKFVNLLRSFGILNKNTKISDREWQCLELYIHGKSANQTGDLLGISRRTVETHFDNLKNKLNVTSKSALIDYIR